MTHPSDPGLSLVLVKLSLPRLLAVLPIDRRVVAEAMAKQRRIELLVQGKVVKDDGSGNGDGARG